MEKFQGLIFKLAETQRNTPLAPAAKTQLQNRLNKLLSDYKTPDHPPYSAMIEKALRELNEKGGSSEESISLFLAKAYSHLPWAHSMLLKHHLGKLCESGDIVLTLGKRYVLAEVNPSPDSSSKSKTKSSQKRKGKWRWAHERKRKKQKRDKVEVAEKFRESDVQEQQLTENGLNVEDKQFEEDQTKILPSCNNGEYDVFDNPSSFPAELRQEEEEAADKLPDAATLEMPPGFESVTVENSSQFGVDVTNHCYLQEKGTPTSTKLGTLLNSEDHHSLQLGLSNAVRPQHRENRAELTPITEQQQHQEEKQPELLREDVARGTMIQGIRTYSRRGKAKSQQPEDVYMKFEHLAEPPSANPLEPTSLATKIEVAKDEKSADLLRTEHQITVYRLRSRASKLEREAEVSTKTNVMDEATCRLEVSWLTKRKRRGRPPKLELDATVQENFTLVDQQRRQELEQPDKGACSGEVEAVKIEGMLLSSDFIPVSEEKPLRGRPPKRRRSAIK